MSETKTDEWGEWQKTPKGSWILIEPSQKYIDEIQIPLRQRSVVRRGLEHHQIKVSEALNRLGEGRSRDDPQVVIEDSILENAIGEISEYETDQVVAMITKISHMSFQQLDDYIDLNVTNLATAKEFLKDLGKVTLAVVKLLRIFMRRESLS